MPDPAGQIEAAGGVLWRPVASAVGYGIEVAIVHRPKYDDWSVPKGKLEPGEYPLLGALREVREETGFGAVPGRLVGETHYLFGGRPKRVRYWAMRATDGSFVSGDEVDELVWLSLPDAAERVDAGHDRRIVEAFSGDSRASTPVIVLRTTSAAGGAGAATEPVSSEIAEVVAAFGPVEVVLAGNIDRRLVDLVHAGTPVLCRPEAQHFDEFVRTLTERFGGAHSVENAVPEGGFVVLHVGAAGELVALDTLPPLG